MPKWLIWAVALGGLVMLLSYAFPEASDRRDHWPHFLYLLLLVVFIGGGVLASYAGEKARALRDMSIWLGIFMLLLVVYSFRHEFFVVKDRVLGELLPDRVREGEANTMTIRMARNGHFYLRAKVNGVPLRFMVDTGATRVVLSPADAKRLGFELERLDFTQRSYTANGMVWGAPVTLDSVEVGEVAIEDVLASVNSAEMDSSLLGMTFLGRLKSYTVRDEVLTLEY